MGMIPKDKTFKRLVEIEKEMIQLEIEKKRLQDKCVTHGWASYKEIDGRLSCGVKALQEHYPELFNQLKDLTYENDKNETKKIITKGQSYPRFVDNGYKSYIRKTL
tara:strand:- start:1831 stop:2148 length:318 start_codon:yes stop_codon:yes gene_type:complete